MQKDFVLGCVFSYFQLQQHFCSKCLINLSHYTTLTVKSSSPGVLSRATADKRSKRCYGHWSMRKLWYCHTHFLYSKHIYTLILSKLFYD